MNEYLNKLLNRKGMSDVLSVIYLDGKVTRYRIAKVTSIEYANVCEKIKELETVGIISHRGQKK